MKSALMPLVSTREDPSPKPARGQPYREVFTVDFCGLVNAFCRDLVLQWDDWTRWLSGYHTLFPNLVWGLTACLFFCTSPQLLICFHYMYLNTMIHPGRTSQRLKYWNIAFKFFFWRKRMWFSSWKQIKLTTRWRIWEHKIL